jgi:hypothetical protein
MTGAMRHGLQKFLSPEPPGTVPERITLRVIGEEWAIDYRATASETVSAVERSANRLLVYGDPDNTPACKDALRRWLARKTREHIVPWLIGLADERDYGSGRSGGRPTVEDSLSLNLPRLFKTGWLKQGAWISGTLRWSIVGTGEETASIGFEARLGEKDGYVRLHWTSTNRWSGEKRQCENRIELTTRAQPLGGRRWWFVCPHTGQLAERLHLPSGAYTFACWKAYRLAYRSQRETPRADRRGYSYR